MDPNELKEKKVFWVWVAEYYKFEFSKNQLDMWAEDLLGHNVMNLKRAFLAYRKDPSNIFMPQPCKILQLLHPEISHRSLADEAAARIYQAIARIGYPNPEEAKAFIGELGWLVVERGGGWMRICETTHEKTKDFTMGKWRDLAMSILERNKFGLAETPPALPQPKTQRLNNLLQAFEGGKKDINQ